MMRGCFQKQGSNDVCYDYGECSFFSGGETKRVMFGNTFQRYVLKEPGEPGL